MKLVIKALNVKTPMQKIIYALTLVLFVGLIHLLVSFNTFPYFFNSLLKETGGSKQVTVFNDKSNEDAIANLNMFVHSSSKPMKKIEVLGSSRSNATYLIYNAKDVSFKTLVGKNIKELEENEIAITYDSSHYNDVLSKLDTELDIGLSTPLKIKSIYYNPLLMGKFYNFLSDKSLVNSSSKMESYFIVNDKTYNELRKVSNYGTQYYFDYTTFNLTHENKEIDNYLVKMNLLYKSDISGLFETLSTLTGKHRYFITTLSYMFSGFLIIIAGILYFQIKLNRHKLHYEIQKLNAIKISPPTIQKAKIYISFLPIISSIIVFNTLLYSITLFYPLHSLYYIQVLRVDQCSILIQLLVGISIGIINYINMDKLSITSKKTLKTTTKTMNVFFFMKRIMTLHYLKYTQIAFLTFILVITNLIIITMNTTLLSIRYPESFTYDYVLDTSYENIIKLDVKDYLIKDTIKTDQYLELNCAFINCDKELFKTKVYSFASSNYNAFFQNHFDTINKNNSTKYDVTQKINKYLESLKNQDYKSKEYLETVQKLNDYYEIWTTKTISNVMKNKDTFLTSSYEIDFPINIKYAKIFNIYDNNQNIIYLLRKSDDYFNQMLQKKPKLSQLIYVKVKNVQAFEKKVEELGINYIEKYQPKSFNDTEEYQNQQVVEKLTLILIIFDILLVYLIIQIIYFEIKTTINQDTNHLKIINKKLVSLNTIYILNNIIIIGIASLVSLILITTFNSVIEQHVYTLLELVKEIK